ncbi:hypothetical protein K1T71_013862 [Dendrolimus kikuchii]|uniref:Uncharacterized protein n=1 Tax=Dendrolimus kikuchii TaxID=765133 RepID=A0ACC1CFZ4_9NEOP|nr:hypothetical protein K1T71_013862 [Dendrolimus kikuchii]
MFVSIFGLPPNVKYQDLKSLIKQQCNLIDIIIDNIVSTPDGTKKVRIGLADDGEAMRLVKGLDGYRLQGNHVIKVVPVGKTQPNPSQQGFDSQQYPPRNEFATNQGGDYRGSQRAPMDSMNRSQPWGPGGQNVWSQESPMAPVPQNNFGYTQGYAQQPAFHPQRPDAPYAQGRPMIDQYGSKPNVPDNRRNVEARSHVLRNIEIVDSPAINQPPTQGRYPPGQGYQQHDKPGAIKDPLRVPTRWEGMANQQGPGHYQAHGELQPWNHQRKPSPGREPGRMMQGRPISPRHGRPISPSRPGLHGRQSPGRPISPRHRMSPERPGRMGRPGSPRQAGRMESGVPGRHSGRPGSPKNYPDLGRPTDGRPGTTGRHMSPGRQHGRPGSPPNRQPGGRPIPSGKGSPPGRHHMRPGSPGMRSSGRPGSPGIRHSGRPGSPGMRPGRPISPGMRPSGRPGSPSMRHSGRPESPGMRSGRPISPGMRLPGRPGSPGMRPSGRPGSPGMRASGRPGSPNMRPSGRSGSPGLRPSGRPGSPGMRPPGRPGSPGMRPPGRPISPGPRTIQEQRPGMGRPGSPGMRLGRPGSPRKLDTFSGRAISPDGRPLPDQRPRMGRPGSPVMFVSGRSGSPGRRLSPHHRPGRPGSPPGRNLSPHSRIPGAPRRTISPNQRRLGDRGDSPRRMSPHRYSPDRHHPDKNDQFDPKFKLARPAYDSMASSKGMYSSAFRPNVPWQKDDKYPKIDDDRREGRIPPRAIEADKRILSTERKSRSPGRRDRSPLKDRFKRHSPSPRSPRRSWALEKRRSPEIREAPPPPVWPGQKRNDDQFGRRNIPDRMEKEEKGKHVPVWELHSDSKDIERRRESRLEQNDRRFEEKGDRRDILNRELRNERFALQNERPDTYSPKFSPREIDDRREFRLNDEKRFSERQARRDFQRRSVDRENRHRDELARQRNASPQHMDEQSIRRNFDKELEDIYKRAVEFRKKTEELRRSGERRREGYTEEDNSVMAYERSRRPKSPDQRDYKKSPLHERRPRSKEKVKAEWKVEQKPNLPEHVKAKREKALKEIMKRLLERQTVCDYLEGEFETRVRDELKLEISKIIQTLFGNEDVSFIEIIIKYQAKFTLKDEELMLQAVLNSLPKPNLKRSGPEISEGAAKTARRSSPTAIKGNRFNHATIKRKPVLVGQKNLQPVKRLKPSQPLAKPPKQVQKLEDKVVKVSSSQKKPVTRQPSLENSSGHYELNPLMNRMLEKELQDIMMKVWQELPDVPLQNPEKMIVDTFRNEAGDELRNVVGLNVAKRILNVYNPLYVKVQFTKRPERDHLKAFLMKYRCIKFERVDAAAKTFTALMKNIQDFDKICSVKSIRIGKLKVYISPNYEFLKCPPNLKINFGNKHVNDDKESLMKINITNTVNEDKNINNAPKLNEKNNIEVKKEVKSETKASPEVKYKVTESQKPTEIKTTPKAVKPATVAASKPLETKPVTVEPAKPAVKVPDNETPKKTIVMKPAEAKTANEIAKPKAQQIKTNEEDNTKPTIPVNKKSIKIEEAKITKPAAQTPVITETKTTKVAGNANKVEEIKGSKPQQEIQKKVIQKQVAAPKKSVLNPSKVVNKPKVSIQKSLGKVDKSKIKTKRETMRILEEGDDYDVLDDDDILALISEGVILDECSGSDTD